MQTTGAAWEMTSLTQEPIFVALLAAAGTLPMFLFCFFAGILADRFDRRRYIIVCQFWMMGVAGDAGGAGLLRPADGLEPAGAQPSAWASATP